MSWPESEGDGEGEGEGEGCLEDCCDDCLPNASRTSKKSLLHWAFIPFNALTLSPTFALLKKINSNKQRHANKDMHIHKHQHTLTHTHTLTHYTMNTHKHTQKVLQHSETILAYLVPSMSATSWGFCLSMLIFRESMTSAKTLHSASLVTCEP